MIRARHYLRTAGFLWLTLSIVHAAEWPATSADKKSGEVFKNLKVLNNTPSDLLLPSMQFITSSLGVHCDYCHAENAFDKDDKRPKQTARQMMRMSEVLTTTSSFNVMPNPGGQVPRSLHGLRREYAHTPAQVTTTREHQLNEYGLLMACISQEGR